MVGNDWDDKLKIIWESPGFNKFFESVLELYKNNEIYPPKDWIFNALKLTSYQNTRVVIVGQDPYHGINQAHGLSFSVQNGIQPPPSLINIFKELKNDLGIEINKNGDLSRWAKEGVLLLNSVLTVEKNKPASHRNIGWELLTDHIIRVINLKEDPVVFILWGEFAKQKSALITNKKHLVLCSSHPSPFSANRGFFGSKPFSKTNKFLRENGLKEINWKL